MALPETPDNGRAAFDYFVSQGLAPHQAAGIVGNLQGESGQNLNPNAVNRGDGRDGSNSIGIGQWNGSRAQALRAFAESKGVPWNDINTQLEFLHSELKGPEAKAYQGVLAAQNPEEAARAFLGYERPKDWNKPGSHPERAQYAAAAHARYTQPAQASPAGLPMGLLPQAPPAMGLLPPQAPSFPQTALGGGLQAATQQQAEQEPFQPTPQGQPPPIFFPQRRSPDLTKLRAALGRPFFNGRG